MSRYTELEVNQQVTADSIREDGVDIVLTRKGDVVPDGAGGFKESSDEYLPRPVQRFWLHGTTLNVRSGNTRQFFQDDSGQRYQVKYVLLGAPDADVQEGDRFTWLGQDLIVQDVHPDRSFETRAQITAWAGGTR